MCWSVDFTHESSKQNLFDRTRVNFLYSIDNHVLLLCISLIKGLYFTNSVCPEETEGERGSEREKLVLTFLLATTGFLIGYAPGVLFYTIVASRDVQLEDFLLYSVLRAVLDLLFYCSLCLNPIFYAFRSAHFKQGFKRLLKCQESTSQNEIQLGA